MKIKRYLLGFFIVFLICPVNTNAQGYEYMELLRFGNTEELVFLSNAFVFIVPDQDGNIFVTNYGGATIYKFNSSGEFIGEFGRRGRGPGEFTEISIFFYDPSSQSLVVYDRMDLRLTRFDLDGEIIEMVKLSEQPIISPWMGQANEEGELFFLYKEPVMPNAPPHYKDDLIHVYSGDFTEKTTSFLARNRFGDISQNYFVDSIVGGLTTGFFDLGIDNELFAVSFIYEGFIYHYKKADGEWQLKNRLNGDTFVDKYYEQINFGTAPVYARKMGTPRGSIAGLIYSESVGISVLDEQYLVVFSYQRDKEYTGEFGYSLFNYHSGDFLSYQSINELSDSSQHFISPIMKITHHGGKFYFVDNRGEEPEIVVAKIEFEIPD